MKTLHLFITCLCLAAIPCMAAPEPKATPILDLAGPYDAGTWTISPVVAYKATEISRTSGQWAGGLAASYAIVDNIAIEVSALSYDLTDSPVVDSFDEGAVNFKGYLPIGKSGFAPFGLIGYTRDHAGDEDLMNAGAGLAYRYKFVEAFVDGQYRQSFTSHGNQFLFRAGLGITF